MQDTMADKEKASPLPQDNSKNSTAGHAPCAEIIVFGNEKGGSGKSTSAMHAAIALLRLGYKVGTLDLDARQGTFTAYMKNRFKYATTHKPDLPMPLHMDIMPSKSTSLAGREGEGKALFDQALAELRKSCDFVVIDTPGAHTHLSQLAHFEADTLVTPLNDSLVDLDVIAKIDSETDKILRPSVYTEMVADQNLARIEAGKAPIHWIVMRNRLSHLNAQNKRRVGALIENMAQQMGFQPVSGFGERVIFKELFLKGLTLLDLKEDQDAPLTLSQLAARQEVRQLVTAIAPEKAKAMR